VREDTVRLWRSEFTNGGVEALETRPLPGPEPVKTQAALRVAEPLLSAPVTNRINWTLARLADEIATREGVTISKSQLSKALRKKILCGWTAARLGRLSFHTSMEATDVHHLRDRCRDHRPFE
jgi:Homeodomain-like domain